MQTVTPASNSAYIMSEEVQNVLTQHSTIARDIRVEIAQILCAELTQKGTYEIKDLDVFRSRYGVFSNFLITIQVIPAWEKLKNTLKAIPEFISMCLAEILDSIFCFMEETTHASAAELTRLNKRLMQFITGYTHLTETLLSDPIFKSCLQNTSTPENESFLHKLFGVPQDMPNPKAKAMQRPSASLVEKARSIISMSEDTVFTEWFFSLSNDEQKAFVSLLLMIIRLLHHLAYFYEHYIAKNANMVDKITGLYSQAFGGKKAGQLRKKLLLSIHDIATAFGGMDDFQKFLDMLGRMTFETGIRSHATHTAPVSDIYAITRSSDIARVIPSELMKLSHSTLKYLFYSELAEQRLITYDLKSSQSANRGKRGPAVVLVDTSGSMTGIPESVAKAFTFALITTFAKENRRVHLLLFSSENEHIEFEFNPSKDNADEVLEFLRFSFDGGTDFDSAFTKALPRFKEEPFRNADLTIITDGGDSLSPSTAERIVQCKTECDMRLYCIFTHGDNDDLRNIADMCVKVNHDGTWEHDNSPSQLINAQRN